MSVTDGNLLMALMAVLSNVCQSLNGSLTEARQLQNHL